MMKPLLLAALLCLAAVPAAALPVVEEMWVITYCSLNPDTILPCLQQGVPAVFLNIQVQHVPGEQVYELTDAQLLSLGLPLPSSGILFDYVSAPDQHFLYSNDRDFWDGVLLPFVALAPPPPHLVLPVLGDTAGPLASTPEPVTMALFGATLVTVGWVARRRR